LLPKQDEAIRRPTPSTLTSAHNANPPAAHRAQLTLFVPAAGAGPIEAVRRMLDPVQFGLIAAHVTLCREDELVGLPLAQWQQRLALPAAQPLTLTFGAPKAFGTHGVLLPCVDGEVAFQALRRCVLGSDAIRHQAPHITLAHPRNPKAAANSVAAAAAGLGVHTVICFSTVSVIEQQGSAPWQVRAHVALRDAAGR
jgi:2'-5' RNA ligase superfamily